MILFLKYYLLELNSQGDPNIIKSDYGCGRMMEIKSIFLGQPLLFASTFRIDIKNIASAPN